jgi:hypothetical protein
MPVYLRGSMASLPSVAISKVLGACDWSIVLVPPATTRFLNRTDHEPSV